MHIASSGQVAEEDCTATEARGQASTEPKQNKTEPCEPVVRVESQSPGECGRNAITTGKGCVLEYLFVGEFFLLLLILFCFPNHLFVAML